MNPYESRPIASSVTPKRLNIFSVFSWAIYTLTSIAVILLASLPIRFPGLSDKASGPAHYWPDDAFHLLLPIAACLMAVSTFVFILRRQDRID